MSKNPAEKAFVILKKNINIWDMKELIELLESYIEEETQRMMTEDYKDD